MNVCGLKSAAEKSPSRRLLTPHSRDALMHDLDLEYLCSTILPFPTTYLNFASLPVRTLVAWRTHAHFVHVPPVHHMRDNYRVFTVYEPNQKTLQNAINE